MAPPLVNRLLTVVRSLPEKECIVHRERRVTYAELGGLVAAFGSALRERIAPGDRVVLVMDNSPEYVGIHYGTWLAGGVPVALNTALKADTLAQLVAHSGAACVVIDHDHPGGPELRGLLDPGVEVLAVEPGGTLDSTGSSPRDGTLGAEALATLIYTSGTTGAPKGVMLSHHNISANTDSISDYLGIGPAERALCVLPFFYSYGASVLHTHMSSGGTLILADSLVYPHIVLELMARERATSFAGVPSTFYLLLRRTRLAEYDLSSLRYVTQAGGAMDPSQIRRFRELVPGADFVVMYGQTEATARLAYVPPSELERKSGSAGRAIPGVELCVRAPDDTVLPQGQIGEVCARGENVMMGYWEDPQGTAAVLRDGWLHTGDLGHMDADGYLFLTGRSREMIKSGAHRISPAEIEDVIRTVTGVEEVAVVGIDDALLGQAIKACIVSRESSDELKREIQRVCRDRLPRFKTPTVVEFRQDLPRTASGKVRRHLL